jgi:cysteine-rich repeat protein
LQNNEQCDDGNLLGGDGCDDGCVESDDQLWITIPAGTYQRGNSKDVMARPVKEVQIAEIQVLRAEVTVKQYTECVDAGECSPALTGPFCNYQYPGREWHPINCIDFFQAKEYAAYADSLDPNVHIRLPSEAEWEYIARSQGVDNKFPWGAEAATCDYAVMRDGDFGCGLRSTAPVCSTSTTNTPRQIPVPNGDTADGLCDMAGNVSEWTLDYFSANYSESFSDARPFLGGVTFESALSRPFTHLRVIRGGAWSQTAYAFGTTYRSRMNRNTMNINTGIRLVSSLCGNGVIDAGEVCDDGNHESFDDCNFLCQEGPL